MLIDFNHPWPYLATAGFVALLGLFAWSQPQRPISRYFYWIIGVWLFWSFAASFATVAKTADLRYGLWVLQAFCVLVASPLELIFSLVYTDNEKWLNRQSLAFIFLPVIIFVLLVIILPRDNLVSIDMRSGVGMLVMNGWLKWVFLTLSYVIWLITVGLLFGSLHSAPAFSVPIALIILGQSIPRIAFFVNNLLQRSNVTPMQILILFSIFTALAYLVCLYHFRFLRVIPIARDKVIYHMPYPMLVLDAENYLVDFNPAAQSLPGLPGKLTLRQASEGALGEWWKWISPLIGRKQFSRDIVVNTNAGRRYFHIVSLPLLRSSGWRIGEVFILMDVTQARQAQQLKSQTLLAQATLQEREQLALELHDGLSQSLAFLSLQAQAIRVQIQTGQSQAAMDSLSRLTDAASQIQEENRELIGNLLAVSLPTENLCAILNKILNSFEKETGLTTHLEMDESPAACTTAYFDPIQLPPSVTVQLVRITQEALANVRKHAKEATQVIVQLKPRNGQLFINIMDDGPGFDLTKQDNGKKHFGFQVMRQRAERIGAQIAVDSSPGKGTHLEICAPLAYSEKRSRE